MLPLIRGETELTMNFEAWVTPHLKNGKGYIAYNFNLYELDEDYFGAELVASTAYDPDEAELFFRRLVACRATALHLRDIAEDFLCEATPF